MNVYLAIQDQMEGCIILGMHDSLEDAQAVPGANTIRKWEVGRSQPRGVWHLEDVSDNDRKYWRRDPLAETEGAGLDADRAFGNAHEVEL